MKKLIIPFFVLLVTPLFAQLENHESSALDSGNPGKDFFITTNSGAFNTPVGLKIGFLGKPGFYLGFRHGIGDVYHSDSDLSISDTYLYSITGGVSLPLYARNNFKLCAQMGAGYGEWWKHRWERWTNSGVELEAGLFAQKGNFLFSATGNVLQGSKTYPTGDFCVGIGFVMNRCK